MRMLMNTRPRRCRETRNELVVWRHAARGARLGEFDRIVATPGGWRATTRFWCSPASRSACSAPMAMRRAC